MLPGVVVRRPICHEIGDLSAIPRSSGRSRASARDSARQGQEESRCWSALGSASVGFGMASDGKGLGRAAGRESAPGVTY
jgi:hypothetical protein